MNGLGYVALDKYERESDVSVTETELSSFQAELANMSQEVVLRLQKLNELLSSDFSSSTLHRPTMNLNENLNPMPPAARLFDSIDSTENTTKSQKIEARDVIRQLSLKHPFLKVNEIIIRTSVDSEILILRKVQDGNRYIIIGPEENYLAFGFAGHKPGHIEYSEGTVEEIIQRFIG